MSYSKVVPAEYNGMARVFMKRLAKEDEALIRVLHDSLNQIGQRRQRKPRSPVRVDMLNEIKKTWLKTATFTRCSVDINTAPGMLDIFDIRLFSTRFKMEDVWEKPVPSVAMGSVELVVNKTDEHWKVKTFAEFGFHALGRYYERCDSKDREDDRLKNCMMDVLRSPPTERKFVIPTLAGAWYGQIRKYGELQEMSPVLHIQTFLPEPRL